MRNHTKTCVTCDATKVDGVCPFCSTRRGVTPVLQGRPSMSTEEAKYLLAHPKVKLLPGKLVDEAREVQKRGPHRREI